MTSAVFQGKGNVLVTKDALIIDVSVGRIAGRLSLMTGIGIYSIPGALFVGIAKTISWICLGFILDLFTFQPNVQENLASPPPLHSQGSPASFLK